MRRRVEGPTPVVDGDRIRLGSLLFTFRVPQPSQTAGIVHRDIREASRRLLGTNTGKS